MKNILLWIVILTLVGTMLFIAFKIDPPQEQNYYYLEVDDVDDITSVVYIVDFNGEKIAMIDNDLYRHSGYTDREWLRDSIETSIGFNSILETSERYYGLIYNYKP